MTSGADTAGPPTPSRDAAGDPTGNQFEGALHDLGGRTGIPTGNTIAVAGDPGTGKTTYLLTYFRSARLGESGRNERGLVLRARRENGREVEDSEPFDALNRLVSPPPAPRLRSEVGDSRNSRVDGETPMKYPAPFLRCFITLESSFARLWRNSALLGVMASELTPQEPLECDSDLGARVDRTAEGDVTVFVDATAFLSGRLEDRLRYPKLENGTDAHGSEGTAGGWRRTALSLGGFGPQHEESFGLYWQDEHASPVRIEQVAHPTVVAEAEEKWRSPLSMTGNVNPFFIPEPEARDNTYRVYDLLTPPLPDPQRRVRLVKDLLAELFVRFPAHTNRLVAIDSLSALTSRSLQIDTEGGADTRRLDILNLVRWLEEYGVTTFLACEASDASGESLARQPLFLDRESRYLVSGVVQLNYHRYASGDLARFLRVLKMRGASHDMRPHGYGLDERGIAWVVPMFGQEQVGVRV